MNSMCFTGGVGYPSPLNVGELSKFVGTNLRKKIVLRDLLGLLIGSFILPLSPSTQLFGTMRFKWSRRTTLGTLRFIGDTLRHAYTEFSVFIGTKYGCRLETGKGRTWGVGRGRGCQVTPPPLCWCVALLTLLWCLSYLDMQWWEKVLLVESACSYCCPLPLDTFVKESFLKAPKRLQDQVHLMSGGSVCNLGASLG